VLPDRKFSIVTPSLNQGRFIGDNIRSVLNQKNVEIEHIIVDACSTDNTSGIVGKYSHLRWYSEPDTGPANAINKGFELSNGEIFGWINADDYYEEDTLQYVADEFAKGADLVYGNLTFVDVDKNLKYVDNTVPYDKNNLLNYAPDVRQPCTFFSKELFSKVNGLDENLKLVFDFEMFVRMLDYASPVYIDMNLAYYRDYDETLTRSNIRKQAIELFFAGRKHGSRLFSVYNKKIIKKLLTGEI
jgi:glycosyltransferase involved in cell wall biosynthesis